MSQNHAIDNGATTNEESSNCDKNCIILSKY